MAGGMMRRRDFGSFARREKSKGALGKGDPSCSNTRCQQRRPALEDADDAGPEPHPLGVGGGDGEWGEAVRAGGLAGPEVGVAERLGAQQVLSLLGQRNPRQRQRQAPATLHAVTL